jgi:hypothetical protein
VQVEQDDLVQALHVQGHKDKPGKTSSFLGVQRQQNRWRVQLRVGGRSKLVGLFLEETDAAAEYDKAILKERGLKARLNYDISNYLDMQEQKLHLSPFLSSMRRSTPGSAHV